MTDPLLIFIAAVFLLAGVALLVLGKDVFK
jgi:hypothetical protein